MNDLEKLIHTILTILIGIMVVACLGLGAGLLVCRFVPLRFQLQAAVGSGFINAMVGGAIFGLLMERITKK